MRLRVRVWRRRAGMLRNSLWNVDRVRANRRCGRLCDRRSEGLCHGRGEGLLWWVLRRVLRNELTVQRCCTCDTGPWISYWEFVVLYGVRA